MVLELWRKSISSFFKLLYNVAKSGWDIVFDVAVRRVVPGAAYQPHGVNCGLNYQYPIGLINKHLPLTAAIYFALLGRRQPNAFAVFQKSPRLFRFCIKLIYWSSFWKFFWKLVPKFIFDGRFICTDLFILCIQSKRWN